MGPVAVGRATGLAACLVALLAACGSGASSPTSPSPGGVASEVPPAVATTNRSSDVPGPAGTTASATVDIGGARYELTRGNSCAFVGGVQLDLSSADGRDSLSVFTSGSVVGLFLFARLLDGEAWQPSGTPARFQVNGSTATWAGPMRDRDSGREEQATITVECGG